MAPIAWPAFIASCEAIPELQDAWRFWWVEVQKYQIGSIEKLWIIVQEVWENRALGNTEMPGWVPVLRKKGGKVISGG